jgi:hypothetical protein
MPNNQLLLKCVCGAELELAKRGDMGYVLYDILGESANFSLGGSFQKFLNDHCMCAGHGFPDHFTLGYECRENYDYE